MKLYDFVLAPNPRRVRLFMAEKGLEIPSVQINLRQGEQFEAQFKQDNPGMIVPALLLDDGTLLTETMAICRYLDALQPTPALFGSTPKEQALVEMWSRRAELEGLAGAAEALRNAAPRFVNRAIPGPRDYAQIPALVERGKARVQAFFDDLESGLSGQTWLAGEHFSVADITAFVVVEFAVNIEEQPAARHVHIARWRAAVAARPSAAA